MISLSCSSIHAQLSLNVTNYGAKGDAVRFSVNTVSNSIVVTTTNPCSAADIGKYIEIYGVGKPTYGVNSYGVTTNDYQDLIAVVTNVVSATNLYLQVVQLSGNTTNYLPQRTLANAYATMGTDNTPIFNGLIQTNAAVYTNATLFIPNGTYLCLSSVRSDGGYASHAIFFRRGGIKIEGESQAGTILLSRGAWQSFENGAYPVRGFLFQIVAPLTNDIPITIANLTADGGVVSGNLDVRGIQCNFIDGLGWDEQHSAILCQGMPTHLVVTNVTSQHWRGEIFKTIGESRNGNVFIHNCRFYDGNASALNIYGSWDVRNNYFEKLFFISELYQSSYTNAAYFTGNFSTNTYAGMSFNGGMWAAPPFVVQSNTFHLTIPGANAFMTMPAANVSFLNNEIHCAQYMTVFAVGAAGSQVVNAPGAALYNTNIVFSGNHIYCAGRLGSVASWGAPAENSVHSLVISSNTLECESITSLFTAASYATNVTIAHNNFQTTYTFSFGISSWGGGMLPLIQSNNIYTPVRVYLDTLRTNLVSYGSGPIQRMDFVATGNKFVLEDSIPLQIPTGACLQIDNRSNTWAQYNSWKGGGYGEVIVYPSQAQSSPVTVTNGALTTFFWNGSTWSTNEPISNMFSLSVNFGSGSGAYASGTAVTVTAPPISGKKFTYWSGATNLMLNPLAANTTFIMPAGDATITANYAPKMSPPSNLRPATTNSN